MSNLNLRNPVLFSVPYNYNDSMYTVACFIHIHILYVNKIIIIKPSLI